MKHEHEALVGNDNLIRCRTCGVVIPYAETEIGKVSSAIMANRMLDELAIKGGLTPVSFENNFIVYAKDKDDGIHEEITAKKVSDRVYTIVKKIISNA